MSKNDPPIVDEPAHEVDGLRSRLIINLGDEQKLTLVRNTDLHTALARGLKEYLAGVSVIVEGGRRLAFVRALVCWAEPEIVGKYPSLVILAQQEMAYEASSMTGATPQLVEDGGSPARYLRQRAEGHQELQVIVWATDPAARMGLAAAVEDAFEPSENQSGLTLELPYYFGVRATYEKLSVFYDDNSADTQRRDRRAIFRVNANAPQMVPVGPLPPMRIRTELDVSDTLSQT